MLLISPEEVSVALELFLLGIIEQRELLVFRLVQLGVDGLFSSRMIAVMSAASFSARSASFF